MLDNLPDDLKINPEIVMNDPMAEPHDFRPFDLGVTCGELVRKAIGRFAKNFKVANNRVCCARVVYKGLLR